MKHVGIFLALAGLLAAPAAFAQQSGVFSGTVVSLAGDLSPEFGTNSLQGDTITGSWSYDPVGYSLGVAGGSPYGGQQYSGYVAGGLVFSVTINGVTVTETSGVTYASFVQVQPSTALWLSVRDYCSSCNSDQLILNSSEDTGPLFASLDLASFISGTVAFNRDTGSSPYGAVGFSLTSSAAGGSGTAVPEPASMALLGLGVSALAAVRRRRCRPDHLPNRHCACRNDGVGVISTRNDRSQTPP